MLAVNEAIRCTGSSHLTKSTESVALWQQNNQNDNCGCSYNGEEKKKELGGRWDVAVYSKTLCELECPSHKATSVGSW